MNNKEKKILTDLREAGLKLAPTAAVKIMYGRHLAIGLKQGDRLAFSSEVNIYSHKINSIRGWRQEINFGVTGGFSPEDTIPYWRTVHAYEVLTNWDSVMSIIDKHIHDE